MGLRLTRLLNLGNVIELYNATIYQAYNQPHLLDLIQKLLPQPKNLLFFVVYVYIAYTLQKILYLFNSFELPTVLENIPL